jgi:hypothetical protein
MALACLLARSAASSRLSCLLSSLDRSYYTLLAWLPSYFELALGLNVQESSFLTLIP